MNRNIFLNLSVSKIYADVCFGYFWRFCCQLRSFMCCLYRLDQHLAKGGRNKTGCKMRSFSAEKVSFPRHRICKNMNHWNFSEEIRKNWFKSLYFQNFRNMYSDEFKIKSPYKFICYSVGKFKAYFTHRCSFVFIETSEWWEAWHVIWKWWGNTSGIENFTVLKSDVL